MRTLLALSFAACLAALPAISSANDQQTDREWHAASPRVPVVAPKPEQLRYFVIVNGERRPLSVEHSQLLREAMLRNGWQAWKVQQAVDQIDHRNRVRQASHKLESAYDGKQLRNLNPARPFQP